MALNNVSILVLEDEPAVSTLVNATLQARCGTVLTAASIGEARALWEKSPEAFDLLLTDYTLPDGSVPAFITELLAARPELLVVLMTGLPEDCLGLEPSLAKRIQIFPKPFRPSELLGFLRELVEAPATV